ncbi:proton-coupled folate transporter-like [Ylistrum balloti]|uniref:proton-coupled folate transporter-like n=1 Tax=Ylistrum balloti TaxID=509963 RepID=UPI002905A74C|nr:proton-coupled folate transporter-like [Ylistrum balloti]
MTSDLETKTLLDNHQEEERTEKNPSDSSTSLLDICFRVVLIILFLIGSEMGGLTKNQYVYKWVEENSNSSTNVMNTSYDSTSTTISPDPCGGSVSAKSEKKDQSEAALWLLYFSLCEHGIAIPMIMMYSSYSDFVGRKPLMMISCIGYCLQYAIKSFIVYKNLSLVYFFIPYVLSGISGGHFPFYIAMSASVADKTDNNKKRAFGVALFEAVTGVGISTAQVGTGYLIKEFGYLYPMVASSGIFAVCFFITLFAIKETRLPRSTKHITIGVHLKNIFGMFLSKSYILTGSVLTFNLTMLTIFLLLMAASDYSTIGALYQLRSPFCWDSSKIGWYGFGTDILKYLFGLVVVKWLQMCLPDVTVIMITITSAIASSVITGFADTSLMLYISSAAGMLSLMSRPLLRAFASNLIEKDKQGAVFGNTYVIDNICNMVGKTIFSEIYARTQTFMAGFVFLIMGVFNLTSLIVFIIICLFGGMHPEAGSKRTSTAYKRTSDIATYGSTTQHSSNVNSGGNRSSEV